MTFQKLLQKASFRGVKFHVEALERKLGFNYKMHVFPGTKRRAYPEELSEVPEILPIDAFLIGSDAHYTKDLLIAACRKREPGKLFHPQVGYVNARCKSFRLREELRRVGKIHFSMEFIEVDLRKPSVIPGVDILDALKKIDQALAAAALELTEFLSTVDMPAYTLARSAELLSKLANTLTSDNGLGRLASAPQDVRDALDSLRDEGKSLLRAPKKLTSNIIKSLEYRPDSAANEAKSHQGSAPKRDLAVAERLEDKCQRSLEEFISLAGILLRLKHLTKNIESTSYSKAREKLDLIKKPRLQEIDLILSMTEDIVRAKIDRSLQEVDSSSPSLVQAYEHFADIRREGEFLRHE